MELSSFKRFLHPSEGCRGGLTVSGPWGHGFYSNCLSRNKGFFPFHSFEQSVLIQANAPKASAFLWAISGALDEDLRFFQRLVDFGTENKHLTEVQQVLPAIQNLDLNRNVATESCYCAIYSSPWAAHADVEDEHFNITK